MLAGVFIDSAVAGVSYETSPSGLSGVTSTTGQYRYAEGDTVIFSIGEIKFPPVAAKGVVTPVDMGASGDTQDLVVKNIAVLLQSLDADGNPDNGISIPPAAVEKATAEVNFDQPYASFANEVLPIVQHSDTSKTVVSESAAVAHLEESIAQTNADSLVGTWYIKGDTYQYALFILDGEHYAAIDKDTAESNGTALETGTYSWNQETGVVTLAGVERTDSNLDANPPMATGNVLRLDGNVLTITDGDETFKLDRLLSTEESPLQGGWSIPSDEELVVFAFTGTDYLMGQKSASDDAGQSGAEIGTYTYDAETKAIVVDTLVDTNGQWGLSHPCAVLNGDGSHSNYEESNYLACGPEGRDIVQTIDLAGDMLIFVSEADTIANGGEEEVLLERINGLPDGDIHLRLEVTLTLEEYSQGALYTSDNATMQCDMYEEYTVGDVEVINETWVLGSNPNRITWVGTQAANYDPATKTISFDVHQPVTPVPGHSGFFDEFWDSFEGTYNPGESNVITGTYTEKYNLTWTRSNAVSTCEKTYKVTGALR